MRKLSLFTLALVCALPLSAGEWNGIGSEGIIDEWSLNLLELSGARLQFRPGAVGTIGARYPIHPNTPYPDWDAGFTGKPGESCRNRAKNR